MGSSKREEIIQNAIKDLKCPKCGSELEVYISSCYDPMCCGILDSVRCYSPSSSGCWWEIEGCFGTDPEDIEELRGRIK